MIDSLVTLRPVLQLLSFGGYLGVLVLAFLLVYFKKGVGYVLPIILWAMHGTAFYLFVLTNTPLTPSEYTTTWSTILRFHGLIVLTLILVYEVTEQWKREH